LFLAFFCGGYEVSIFVIGESDSCGGRDSACTDFENCCTGVGGVLVECVFCIGVVLCACTILCVGSLCCFVSEGVIGVGFSCECSGESIVLVGDCCELVERVV